MFQRWIVLAGALALTGCGDATTKVKPPTPAQQAKVELERVAKTGMVDSAIFLVRENLEAMKETGAARADELLKTLDELEKIQDKKKVRRLATEIIRKLESSSKQKGGD